MKTLAFVIVATFVLSPVAFAQEGATADFAASPMSGEWPLTVTTAVDADTVAYTDLIFVGDYSHIYVNAANGDNATDNGSAWSADTPSTRQDSYADHGAALTVSVNPADVRGLLTSGPEMDLMQHGETIEQQVIDLSDGAFVFEGMDAGDSTGIAICAADVTGDGHLDLSLIHISEPTRPY